MLFGGWFLAHGLFLPGLGGRVLAGVSALFVAGIVLRAAGRGIPAGLVGWPAVGFAFAGLMVDGDLFVRFGMAAVLGGAVALLGPLTGWAAGFAMACALVMLAVIALDGRMSGVVAVIDVAVLLAVRQALLAPVAMRFGPMLLRTLGLAVPVGILVGGAFLAFPEVSQRTNTALAGFAGELNPGGFHGIRPGRRLAQVATFDGRVPRISDWYWRGRSLDLNAGFRWRPGSPEPRGVGGEVVRYTLVSSGNTAPVPLDVPADPDGPAPAAGEEIARISSVAPPTDPPDPSGRMLEVPRTVRDDARVARVVGELFAGSPSPGEAIGRLEEFFREGGFTYSLRPGRVESVGSFLETGRRGYCEHYAAVSANLLRLAGLPARVVTGYYGGNWNPWLRTISVRDADAHAWVEVWDATAGHWVRFDPTRSVAPDFHARIEAFNDPDRWPWFRFVTAAAETAVARFSAGFVSVMESAGLWVLAILVLGGVAARIIFKNRPPGGGTARAALERAERAAAARNLGRRPGESPLVWMRRLAESGRCEAGSARALAAYYENAVYAEAGPVGAAPRIKWLRRTVPRTPPDRR